MSFAPSGDVKRRSGLLRVLGFGFALAVTIGNTVGAGILRTPGEIAANVPSAPWFLGLWIMGGAYALLGAISLAELATMMPDAGGYYVYVRRGLGDYPAFVVGWSDCISQCAAIAGSAMVVAEYGGELFPGLAPRPFPVAAGMIVVLAVSQSPGVRWASAVQIGATALKGLTFLALLLVLFGAGTAAGPAPAQRVLVSHHGLVTSFIYVLYTFTGWCGIIYLGEEVIDVSRTIPRALFSGVAIVTAIYVLTNLAILRVLSLPAIAAHREFAVGAALSTALHGHGAAVVKGVAILLLLGMVHASQMLACRIPLAMSRERLLPRSFALANEGGTPLLSLGLTTGVSLVFLATNSFEDISSVFIFFVAGTDVATFSTLFALRRREPRAERPFRARGYPWSTALALGAALAILAALITNEPRSSMYALGTLLLSGPIYLVFRRAVPAPQAR